MWLGILAVIGKVLDLINPWSNYWVSKRTKIDNKKEVAQLKMDEATQKGDTDAFLDARADKHSSD